MLPLTLLTIFSSLLPAAFVSAGSNSEGQSCSQGNNRLEIGTYQFDGDCDSVTYCASNSTCVRKGCRNDVFPFGYSQGDNNLPPLCPQGQFCPDEMDACQPLLAVGSACQLNRDDECEAPPNFKDLADKTDFGLNSNGSVCLNFQCMWANVTVGLACVVENTAYTVYSTNNETKTIVSRDNCAPSLYCDASQLVCMQKKDLDETCEADKECLSMNCSASQKCGTPTNEAEHLGVWVYVVVGVCIFGGMFGTLIGLFFMHSRQREKEREKRTQYWREQNAFRQNILQMRDTARASLLSLPLGNGTNSARSTIYSREGISSEESNLPILQNAGPKGSGLRHQQYSEEEYEGAEPVRERDDDGPRYRSGRAF